MSEIDAIDPLERLLNLVALLLDHGRPMTFDEIQDAMEGYEGSKATAKRKFERDKDVLREYDVPIETGTTDVLGGEIGYVISRDAYYLPEIDFTPAEITALFVAAQSGTAAAAASTAVRKLLYGADGGILSGAGGGPLVAGADTDAETVAAAADAAASRRRVTFGYRNAQGVVRDRDVDAYGVVFRRGHWYLVGADRERDEIRAFRLSRCTTRVADTGDGSSPPTGFQATDHVQGGPWEADAQDRAEVAFGDAAAALARSRFTGWERLDRASERRVILSLPMADEETMAALLLQFGPDAEVLGPASLRALVQDRLRDLAEAVDA
ncbi:MAG TPA: WYL domain-containing protein [Actinomycetota bacterium]|nr:WYL domain-containing protein [Actinomycetota bacterium]